MADDNDIVGHIAYSIYKNQKIELIKDFKEKNKREPDESDMATINGFCNSPHSVDSYKMKSEAILATTFELILREAMDEQENRISKGHTNMIEEAIKKHSFSKKKTVWLGFLSSFAFSIFVALMFIFGKLSQDGNWMLDFIKNITN
ncbi:MAG: hypothetical protein ACRC5A_07940 [Enterobacteriaceae bacterium]